MVNIVKYVNFIIISIEFLAANISKNIWINQEDRLKNAFHIFDVKNTGKVTVNELKTIFGSISNFSENIL